MNYIVTYQGRAVDKDGNKITKRSDAILFESLVTAENFILSNKKLSESKMVHIARNNDLEFLKSLSHQFSGHSEHKIRYGTLSFKLLDHLTYDYIKYNVVRTFDPKLKCNISNRIITINN